MYIETLDQDSKLSYINTLFVNSSINTSILHNPLGSMDQCTPKRTEHITWDFYEFIQALA